MFSSTSASARRSRAMRLMHGLASPFFRYRHAKMIHAVRVALGMATSFLVTTGINIPHGSWASVSLLVVVGGLQHYGNIRKKAAERALGTALGAAIGLALILVETLFGSLTLFFILMSAIAGACAYYAIGKAGYVALLTAITMVIVAGHGDSPFDVGLWRTANVLIGIAIALAFSFVLPQYATYSWRYRLADNLRESARLYGALLDGTPLLAEETARRFFAMSQRLVQSRALMESVAKETRVPVARLEEIQRLHRSILAALEMLVTSMPDTPRATCGFALDCSPHEQQVRQKLLKMARALRFGRVGLLYMRADANADASVEAEEGDGSTQGMHWLAMRFAEQVDRLRLRLSEIERQWNIEGARPLPG
ncbi:MULTISPECIES: FUSC family protein [unclassified Caballeronia]|uniref:FUSC family protein n=1 Tax=unclassified Caballeronia TaxID=2646786 RepID=UPI002029AAC4|nr:MULTISPECIES: FUSC family protein [unclassified Caballeronia]